MADESKRHRAVLNVKIEVHELLSSGECAGRPVRLSEHPGYNLRPSMLFSVDGETLHQCLLKLKEKLENIR